MMPQLTWTRWIIDGKGGHVGLNLNNTDWASKTSSAGVYVIYYKTEYGTRKVVYVGQSINVGERLNEHKKTSDIQAYSHLVLYANYAVVSDSTDRDNAEADLIRHYSPPANDVHPPTTSTTTTLPF